MSEQYDYIKHFLNKYIFELERNFEKFFPLLYKFYNKSTGSFFTNMSVQPPEVKTFYNIMCSFADDENVVNAFDTLKKATTEQPEFKNKSFWHLSDGYLQAESDGFITFMHNIQSLTEDLAIKLAELERDGNIDDIEHFVKYNLPALEQIVKYDKKHPNRKMSSYGFGEIVAIKNLIYAFKALIYDKALIISNL